MGELNGKNHLLLYFEVLDGSTNLFNPFWNVESLLVYLGR